MSSGFQEARTRKESGFSLIKWLRWFVTEPSNTFAYTRRCFAYVFNVEWRSVCIRDSVITEFGGSKRSLRLLSPWEKVLLMQKGIAHSEMLRNYIRIWRVKLCLVRWFVNRSYKLMVITRALCRKILRVWRRRREKGGYDVVEADHAVPRSRDEFADWATLRRVLLKVRMWAMATYVL